MIFILQSWTPGYNLRLGACSSICIYSGWELAPVSVSIWLGACSRICIYSVWEWTPVSFSISWFGAWPNLSNLAVVYSSICIYTRFKLTPVSLSMQDWSLLQYLDLTMELIPRGFKGLVLIPENCDFRSQFGLLNQQFSIFLLFFYFFWSAYAFWTKNYKMTKS